MNIAAGNAGKGTAEHHGVRIAVAVRPAVEQRADGAVLFPGAVVPAGIDDPPAQRVIEIPLFFQVCSGGAGDQRQRRVQRLPLPFGQPG